MKVKPRKIAKALMPYGALIMRRKFKQDKDRVKSEQEILNSALVNAKKINNLKEPEVVVSLTTYGDRISHIAPLSIASLFNQTVMPDRIVLWLAYGEKPTKALKKLSNLGLEILYTKDIKSYKKLVPALKKYPKSIIITVDDDVIYPVDWLEKTLGTAKKNPKSVIFNRGRRILINNGKIEQYDSWPILEYNIKNSSLMLPTGVGGVLYPQGSLDKRVFDEKLFMSLANHGDDIWFWAMTELTNTKRVLVKDGFNNTLPYELDNQNTNRLSMINDNTTYINNLLGQFPELYKKVSANIGPEITTIKHDGLDARFNVTNPNDWIQKIQRITGQFYEIEMLQDIQNRLSSKNNNVIIDAGAYIGNHSIFFATHCKASKVISFEPFKESYDKLMDNIRLNGLDDRITTYNCALGDKKGKAKINVLDSDNQGANKIDVGVKGNIKIIPLDTILLDDLDRLDLIKIDVEGMEIPLVKGSLKTIHKFSPILYIEAFEMSRLIELIKILSPLGYSIVDVFNATPTYLFIRNVKTQ